MQKVQVVGILVEIVFELRVDVYFWTSVIQLPLWGVYQQQQTARKRRCQNNVTNTLINLQPLSGEVERQSTVTSAVSTFIKSCVLLLCCLCGSPELISPVHHCFLSNFLFANTVVSHFTTGQ